MIKTEFLKYKHKTEFNSSKLKFLFLFEIFHNFIQIWILEIAIKIKNLSKLCSRKSYLRNYFFRKSYLTNYYSLKTNSVFACCSYKNCTNIHM